MEKRTYCAIALTSLLILIPFCNQISKRNTSNLEKNIETTNTLNNKKKLINSTNKYYNQGIIIENPQIPPEIHLPKEDNSINFPKIPYKINLNK
jgi:hypothetical protein